MLGAEVFKQDAKSAETAVTQLGTSSEASAKKVAPLGAEVDKAGKASAGAKAPVDAAGASTKKLGDESSVAAPKVKQTAAEVERLKKESDEAGQMVGAAAVGIGAAFAAMSTLAVAKFADFDQAVSQVGAATMASAEDLDALSASAVQAGVDTVFTATKAANAQTELAKAGVSVNDILGGALVGSLALASAGELEVARAAEIAATTLTVFGLKGTEAMNVADLLAAGAGKAQGSVDDLALGLEYVGPTFARLNIPLESTVGTLAMLASNGILGEKAGTGLRGVMQALTAPTKAAATQMEDLGINVFDAQGNFIGMEGAAGQLQKGLGGLDEQTRSAAMGAIFGAESANVAGILYAQGAEGVAKWTENVDDQGFASEQASMKLDNLSGDIEMLGGSMDAALIKTGSVANDSLRTMVQIITGLVDWYSNLDEGLQGTVFWFGVGTAAVFLMGGTALLAVPKIVAFRTAMTALNTTMRGTAVATGAIGIAITGAVVLLGMFAAQQAESKARTDDFSDSLDANTGAFTDNTREKVVNSLQGSDVAKTAELLGISLKTMTDAVLGEADALKEVNDVLAIHRADAEETGVSSGMLNKAFLDVEEAISGTSGELSDARSLWQEHRDAMGESAEGADDAAPSYEELSGAVEATTTAVGELAEELNTLNGTSLDSREAARQLEAAYDDFDQSLIDNGTTLDTTTEKGRNNEAALDAIADKALVAGDAIIASGGSFGEYQNSLTTSRDSILRRINDLGITGQAAEDLANKILQIPSDADFTMIAETAAAAARLQKIQDLINGIGRTSALHISTGPGGQGGLTQADGGVVSYYANGSSGRSEHHVAQIAAAGTMRVWAEPETGGEAYIPLAPAKRGRSTAILDDVAGQFGYQLVPYGAQGYADGASDTSSRAAGTSQRSMTGMRLEGTLDLGNGLTGMMRAVVTDVLDREEDTRNAGYREGF